MSRRHTGSPCSVRRRTTRVPFRVPLPCADALLHPRISRTRRAALSAAPCRVRRRYASPARRARHSTNSARRDGTSMRGGRSATSSMAGIGGGTTGRRSGPTGAQRPPDARLPTARPRRNPRSRSCAVPCVRPTFSLPGQSDAVSYHAAGATRRVTPEGQVSCPSRRRERKPPHHARAAIAAAQRFIDKFNAQDHEAHADTLNYPHIRLANGAFTTIATRDAFIERSRAGRARLEAEGWDHSTVEAIDAVHAGDDKVHLALSVERRQPTAPSTSTSRRSGSPPAWTDTGASSSVRATSGKGAMDSHRVNGIAQEGSPAPSASNSSTTPPIGW